MFILLMLVYFLFFKFNVLQEETPEMKGADVWDRDSQFTGGIQITEVLNF